MSKRLALPWTRVLAGSLRGMCFRASKDGGVLAWARTDAEKAAVDAGLRAKGELLVEAPKGCQFEEVTAPDARPGSPG
jgi:hypothetical protein